MSQTLEPDPVGTGVGSRELGHDEAVVLPFH